MKKVILAMVFIFATGTMMNANSNNLDFEVSDCLQDAWDFGTAAGGSDFNKWYATNSYYEVICGG